MPKNENNEEYQYAYYKQKTEETIHHYYLYGEIEEPKYYASMIHHFFHAEPNETIKIHLNTQGGSLETGVAIINGMLNSQAHIIALLESQAFSMGTLIFLSAKEWVVYDNTLLMFHNYSGETWGKGNEIVAHIAAQEKWHREITKNLYMPFLSKEEYEKVLEGADLWFHPDDIRKRLNKVVKKYQKDKNE